MRLIGVLIVFFVSIAMLNGCSDSDKSGETVVQPTVKDGTQVPDVTKEVGDLEITPVQELARAMAIPFEEGMSLDSLYKGMIVETQLKIKSITKKTNKCDSFEKRRINSQISKTDVNKILSNEEVNQEKKTKAISHLEETLETEQCSFYLHTLLTSYLRDKYLDTVFQKEGFDEKNKEGIRISFLGIRAVHVQFSKAIKIESHKKEKIKNKAAAQWKNFASLQVKLEKVIPDFENNLKRKCPGPQGPPILCWEEEKALLRKAKQKNRQALAILAQFQGVKAIEIMNKSGRSIKALSKEILYLEDDLTLKVFDEFLNRVHVTSINELAEKYVDLMMVGHEELIVDGEDFHKFEIIYKNILRQTLYVRSLLLGQKKLNLSQIPELKRLEADISKMSKLTPEIKSIEKLGLEHVKANRYSAWKRMERLESKIMTLEALTGNLGLYLTLMGASYDLDKNSHRLCDYFKEIRYFSGDTASNIRDAAFIIVVMGSPGESIEDLNKESLKLESCKTNKGLTVDGYMKVYEATAEYLLKNSSGNVAKMRSEIEEAQK